MYLERFYDDTLAQASWLVGCKAEGVALVVDPNRDPEPYLRVAERRGLRITHVAETHIHADFVSGVRELAGRTGATMLLSAEGGPDWSYRFASDPGVRLIREGDEVVLGNVRVRALHTPGHTPEHISLLVTDGAASIDPVGVFTGDFVFVGDVGRPDLLETAVGVHGAMAASARQLWASLERFRGLPDHLQIWPGHGAGSACGKSLGALPQSTLGYEKRTSWAFAAATEADFVRQVLDDQPEPPTYFARMKRVNRDGPRVLLEMPRPPHLAPQALPADLSGAWVVDLRSRDAFAGGHLPGSISLPLRYSFTNWAGWLLPADVELHLLAEREDQAREAARLLTLIGLERVAGWVDVQAALAAWRAAGRAVETAPASTPAETRAAGDPVLLDVRGQAEWDGGHFPEALHIHLGTLPDRLGEIPRGRPVHVYCRSGARSAIAQSLLLRAGFADVRNVEGGWTAWTRAGLPVVRPQGAAAD